jgi:PEP-CTERM motif
MPCGSTVKWLALAELSWLFVSGEPAIANMILFLDGTGSLDVIIIDGQPAGAVSTRGYVSTRADPDGLVNGIITYHGPVGPTFTANIATGMSKPNIGPAGVELSQVSVTSVAAGELHVFLTDTDFLFGGAEGPLTLANDWAGMSDGSVEAVGGVDFFNREVAGDMGTPIQGPFGPGAFSDAASVGFVGTGSPFSITEAVVVQHTGGGQVTSFNMATYVTPEPGTLLLLGSGLMGLAFYGRRERKRSPAFETPLTR